MILKNIQLPAVILAALYKHPIVAMQNNGKATANQPAKIRYLGGNNKHILLLVKNAAADYLPDSELIFLSGVLSACNLSLDDIAIVNLNKWEAPQYKHLPDLLRAEMVILSGIDLSILELSFNIPSFQLQVHNEKTYVCIPELGKIKSDTALKNKLWELLKTLFSI